MPFKSSLKFAFKKVTHKTVFLKVYPLMQQLAAAEGSNTIQKSDNAAAVRAWRKAQAYGYRIYYAESQGNLLGVLGLTELRDPLDKQKAFHLNNFIVAEKFRKRGVGTEMLLRVEQIAKREKASAIVLEVFPANKRAIRFYQRSLGYKYWADRLLKNVS